MSYRSLARRPRQRLGRRAIPPRAGSRPAAGSATPRAGIVSRLIPAAVIVAGIVVLVVVALGQLGTATSHARTEREVVTAADGVVQSTVSGTGSLEPVTDESVDFQTSGTLAHVDVSDGEYVHKGQLLATLQDTDASLTLEEAQATLAQARTTEASDEKTLADSSSSSSDDTSDDLDSTDSTDSTGGSTSAASDDVSDTPDAVAEVRTSHTGTAPTATTPTHSGTATTTTTVTTTTGSPTTAGTTTTETTKTSEPTQTTTTRGSTTVTSGSSGSLTSGSSGSSSSGSTGSSSSGSSTVTTATVDADKLQVVEDEATVSEDRQALAQTRLLAPVSGTITSLESIQPGDTVSSGTDSSAAGDSSSDASSATGGSSGATSGASSASTGSSSSSSSSFAEIDSLKHLSMTVSFTEADIGQLKVGETAVVTLDAISGLELAGTVTNVSSIGTTSDDVTSYDATITLNQYDSRVKPGMSASAEVITKQAHGVTVPSAAVTGTGTLATVTEDVNGKDTSEKVIVGLRGTSRDLIVSGLSAGAELIETETLPAEGSSASTSSSGTSATSGFSGRGLGGGGTSGRTFGGGGFGGAAGGGPP